MVAVGRYRKRKDIEKTQGDQDNVRRCKENKSIYWKLNIKRYEQQVQKKWSAYKEYPRRRGPSRNSLKSLNRSHANQSKGFQFGHIQTPGVLSGNMSLNHHMNQHGCIQTSLVFLPILKQAYLGTFDWTLEYNQVMLVAFVLVPWLKIWDFLLPEIGCWWSMSAKVLIEIPLAALLGWFNLMWAWERLNHVDTFEGFDHHSLS